MEQSIEQRKRELALQIARGTTNILQCEDVFEGSTPEVCISRLVFLVAEHWQQRLTHTLLVRAVCSMSRRLSTLAGSFEVH